MRRSTASRPPTLIGRIKARTTYVGECFIYNGVPSAKTNNEAVVVQENGVRYTLGQFSFYYFHGRLNRNKTICHTCDNNRCWNPEHIYEGNDWTNSRDRMDRGRQVVFVGSAHPTAIINEDTAREIKRLFEIYKRRYNAYSIIGRKLNITRQIVRHVVVGANWRHV